MQRWLDREEYRRLGRAIADARGKAGLSQYELADRMGVHQTLIAKVEVGRRRIDVIEFLELMRALGLDHREVLDGLRRSGG